MCSRKVFVVLSLVALVGFAAVAQAGTIGVKYSRTASLAASDVAGYSIYAQANWNNAAAVGQGPPNTPINALKDGNGVATSVNLTSWTQTMNNSWTLNDTASPNAKLLTDFSDQQAAITFSGLNTFAPAGYTVVVYYSNNEGPTTSTLTITGTANDLVSRKIRTGNTALCSYSSVGFLEETGAVQPPTSSTNVTVFSGLNDAGFTVAMTGSGNNGIAAVQIVANEIPEPSTLVLVGFGLAGLVAYAWRKRK